METTSQMANWTRRRQMAKRNRSVPTKVREKRKKEGRGLGTGKDYKPELRIAFLS